MGWKRNVVTVDDYVDEVQGLWLWDYRVWVNRREVQDYQIIVFVGDPKHYYIRDSAQYDYSDTSDTPVYDKSSCLPPYRRLCDAKAAVEMLLAMQA